MSKHNLSKYDTQRRSKKLTISDTVGADLEIRWDPLVSTGLDTEYLSTGQGQII